MTRSTFLQKVKHYLPPNPVCAEIGVLQGEFSEMILRDLKPSKLYLIDPFETGKEKYETGIPIAYSSEEDYKIVKGMFGENEKVVIYRGYSHEAITIFYDHTVDFIYHDASHLYADVKRDLNEWKNKLSEGGIMALHDYVHLNDFGVIQATDEFCKENNFEILILNEYGGDVALRKI